MPAHRTGEHPPLNVLPELHEFRRVVGVGDPLDVLLDDRTLIEVRGRVVGGRADEFHPAGMGLVVRAGPLEGGEERVVDVDHPAVQRAAEVVGEDLHVTGHDDELGALRLHELQQFRLGLGLRGGGDRNVVERDPVELRDRGERLVIGHDRSDIDREPRRALAEQQIVEAVRRRRDHNDRAHRPARHVEFPRHAELLREPGERGAQFGSGGVGFELHPHEEQPGIGIAELLRLGDVPTPSGDRRGDCGYDPRSVGAGEGYHPLLRSHASRVRPTGGKR